MKKYPCPRSECREVWIYDFDRNTFINHFGDKCKIIPSVYTEQSEILDINDKKIVNIFECSCGCILSFQVIHPRVFGMDGDGSGNYYF